MERYRHLNTFLKEKFGERTLKICVDAGFTCPNRNGTKGYGGCIFCSERGSGEHIKEKDIASQVTKHLNSYRGERANKFIVYFQNFTNTYDTVENLRKKYNEALIDERIVGIGIATRPDCINEEVVKLIASYKENYYVFVELGLQTANDKTGEIINRCYTTQDFVTAVKLLNNYNIDVVAHIMVGLPNENFSSLENTVALLNTLNIQGIKIHSTYVVAHTKLEELYNTNEYTPLTLDYYLECVKYVITHISPNVIIHRISGDAPKKLLVAPEWNSHKKLVLNGITNMFEKENLYQGMYFETDTPVV